MAARREGLRRGAVGTRRERGGRSRQCRLDCVASRGRRTQQGDRCMRVVNVRLPCCAPEARIILHVNYN